MTRVAADDFASGTLQPWWSQLNPGLLSEAPVVASGYVRARLVTGGAAGSFHFDDNDGWLLYQTVYGDFDAIADCQAFGFAESAPPSGGAARLFGLTAHSPVRPESPEYLSDRRTYYHRGIGRAPGGTAGDTESISEWKYTRDNPGSPPPTNLSTWDTQVHPSPSDCRAWLRLRRVGTTVTSWHAAPGDIPAPGGWSGEHSIAFPELPERLHVGLMLYSSTGTADVTGRCYDFANFA